MRGHQRGPLMSTSSTLRRRSVAVSSSQERQRGADPPVALAVVMRLGMGTMRVDPWWRAWGRQWVVGLPMVLAVAVSLGMRTTRASSGKATRRGFADGTSRDQVEDGNGANRSIAASSGTATRRNAGSPVALVAAIRSDIDTWWPYTRCNWTSSWRPPTGRGGRRWS